MVDESRSNLFANPDSSEIAVIFFKCRGRHKGGHWNTVLLLVPLYEKHHAIIECNISCCFLHRSLFPKLHNQFYMSWLDVYIYVWAIQSSCCGTNTPGCPATIQRINSTKGMFDFHLSQCMYFSVDVIDCVQAVVLLLGRQKPVLCDATQDHILPLGIRYTTLKRRVCSTLWQRMLLGRKLQYNNSEEGGVA